ncbi:MAG: hypothetical protein CVV18_06555 [Gammaproteobacteria bacterium HGW-Gammaproteobacteria-8]|nr:MAG: hypothetical protein CVV18_06555 [Gammaproteobacteria bacterium HGW-Gammaproteobacteria-8]
MFDSEPEKSIRPSPLTLREWQAMATFLRLTAAFLISLLFCGTLLAEDPKSGDAVRYFRVAEIDDPCFHCESFVLPLSNPDDIAHAENLIAHGPSFGGSIAVARITAGPDGINRNLELPEAPLWSWHVVGFDGFADVTIELCDGWPSLVESDVDEFIRNTGAQICFWGWTVVDELDQVRGQPAMPVPAISSGWILLLMITLAAWGGHALRASNPAAADH